MNNKTKALLMIGVVGLIIYTYLTHTKNPIENTRWSCEKGECYVTLTITMNNPYNYATTNKVVLRAHRRDTHDQKVGGSGMRLVGEKYIEVVLESNEKKEITEEFRLTATSRVDMLVAKNIKTKRTDYQVAAADMSRLQKRPYGNGLSSSRDNVLRPGTQARHAAQALCGKNRQDRSC